MIRLSGNVPAGATFTFLGVPSTALPATGGWRGDFASQPLSTAREGHRPGLLDAPFARRPFLPGRTFALPVSNLGDDIGIRAFFISPLGDFDSANLGGTNGSGTVILHGRIPFPHARLTSLVLYLAESRPLRLERRNRDPADCARACCGSGRPTVDGKTVAERVRGLGRDDGRRPARATAPPSPTRSPRTRRRASGRDRRPTATRCPFSSPPTSPRPRGPRARSRSRSRGTS